jgi:hypothetical protein
LYPLCADRRARDGAQLLLPSREWMMTTRSQSLIALS